MSEIKRATRNRIKRLEKCVPDALEWTTENAGGAGSSVIRQLHNRVARTATTIRPDTCEWKYDSDTCSWDTECGEKHQFTNDGPKENNHHFCPYCGALLTVAPHPNDQTA